MLADKHETRKFRNSPRSTSRNSLYFRTKSNWSSKIHKRRREIKNGFRKKQLVSIKCHNCIRKEQNINNSRIKELIDLGEKNGTPIMIYIGEECFKLEDVFYGNIIFDKLDSPYEIPSLEDLFLN